jgi:hypothetical protein
MISSPTLKLSLAPDQEGEFEIEELTFNPFFNYSRYEPAATSASMWLELHIRRIDTAAGLASVPDILLEFSHDAITTDGPSCSLQEQPTANSIDNDLNFILHMDIWYSFVRLSGIDREFMTTGYKHAVRMLYACQRCLHNEPTAEHITAEPWITRRNVLFDSETHHDYSQRLLHEVRLFNQVLSSHAFDRELVALRAKDRMGIEMDLLTPRDDSRFAPVLFERPASQIRARFAVRRIPWAADIGELDRQQVARLYGVSYGGTASVRREGNAYRLSPLLFSLKNSEYISPFLYSNEAIRFWVRWTCPAALRHHKERDRFGFTHSLRVSAAVQYFNSFLRMPPGFEYSPGSITEYMRYSVPPHLFFLWDDHTADQCLAYSLRPEADGTTLPLDLHAEFEDKEYARRQIVSLFIIAFLINFAMALLITDLYAVHTPSAALSRGYYVSYGAAIGISVLLSGALRAYRGKQMGLTPLVSAFFLSFFLAPSFERSGLLFAGILLTAVGLLALSFVGLKAIKNQVARLLEFRRLRAVFLRERFLRSITFSKLEERTYD